MTTTTDPVYRSAVSALVERGLHIEVVRHQSRADGHIIPGEYVIRNMRGKRVCVRHTLASIITMAYDRPVRESRDTGGRKYSQGQDAITIKSKLRLAGIDVLGVLKFADGAGMDGLIEWRVFEAMRDGEVVRGRVYQDYAEGHWTWSNNVEWEGENGEL